MRERFMYWLPFHQSSGFSPANDGTQFVTRTAAEDAPEAISHGHAV